MTPTKLLVLLLGVTVLLATIEASGRPQGRRPKSQQKIQNDYPEDQDCEEDDEFVTDNDGKKKPRRIGASAPKSKIQNDEGDGVEDPTDEDYLKYEDTNQEGICILERGKCPQGDWKMFKRRNESVCLQAFGSPHTIDAVTAERVCRQNANARLMSLDNQEEREWLWTTALAKNGSYDTMLIAGRRDRKCHVKPWECRDTMKVFPPMDGTANHEFLHSKWWGTVPGNAFIGDQFDDCLVLRTAFPANDMNNVIKDHTCKDFLHTFLCGITVM